MQRVVHVRLNRGLLGCFQYGIHVWIDGTADADGGVRDAEQRARSAGVWGGGRGEDAAGSRWRWNGEYP